MLNRVGKKFADTIALVAILIMNMYSHLVMPEKVLNNFETICVDFYEYVS